MSINALFIEHNVGDIFTVLDENFNKYKVIATSDESGGGCTTCVLYGVLCPHLNCCESKGLHYELFKASKHKV